MAVHFLRFTLMAVLSLILLACQRGPGSYQPENGGTGANGEIVYTLNCHKGDLNGCNQVAIEKCAEQGMNTHVISHFVAGSEVLRLTFQCTSRAQQLIPETINFDDGQSA